MTDNTQAGEYPPLPEPKFARVVDGIPCITLLEHGVLMRTALASAAPAPQLAPAPSAVADLIAALEEARSAINSMKVEADKDELHDALAARAARKQGANHDQ